MCGFIVAARAPVFADYWRVVVVSMVLMATGMALATGPATDAVLAALPSAKAGVGSAVNDTTRELGGALGVAITGSVLSWSFGSHLADSWTRLGLPHAAVISGQSSLGSALAISNHAAAAAQAARGSFMAGLHAGSVTVAGAAFLAALVALIFLPPRDKPAPGLPAQPESRSDLTEARRAS
jgi:MFS transporter, DHA2 family, multidrug resistance protein